MQLTVLGKSPAWQDAGGACTGFLVVEGDTTLLLDCGNGVFAKLRRFIDYTEVDAIVVSHMHADHFLDLIPFAYALIYSPRQQPVPVAQYPGTDSPARPRLHGPPGARATLRRVTGAWGAEELIEDAFEVAEYDPDSTLEVGDLRVSFGAVPHFIETYGIDVRSSVTGGRLTFGADSKPGEELVELARGTDLLLVESTLPRPERTGVRGHLTPSEAGEHARRAGAGHVVLTHVSDELDPDWLAREASEAFGASVEVAREGATFEL